jgi:hypothetical protein
VRLEAVMWTGVTVYFLVITVIYASVGGDAAGGVPLGTGVFVGGLVAGWSWRWRQRHGDRAADVVDADASDETGALGIYTTASLRPLGLAAGMTAIALGVPVGNWMIFAGVAIVASQVALMVRDADQ